jgi:type IV pilus assembly protein PilE
MNPLRRLKPAGVTLIELLVVLAIVGILSMVALPTYLAYQLEAGRSTGASCLIDAEYRLAQHDAKTGSAAATLAAAGVPERCGDTPAYLLSLDDGRICGAGAGSGRYALRARGEDRQADDGDLVLCVDPSVGSPGLRLTHLHSRPDAPDRLLPGWDFKPGQ